MITPMSQKQSGRISHRCIVLVITAGRVVELKTLPEVQLVLLYTKVNGMNLLLHDRDGLLHG